MTITQRTADVRTRLAEIDATAGLPRWSQRKEHLVRACFAHAAALSGERAKIEVYIEKGWRWCDDHPDGPGRAKMESKVLAAIEAHKAASDTLKDALRLLAPIEGVEMPVPWNPGIDWTENAA